MGTGRFELHESSETPSRDAGFLLLGAIVAIALILLVLGIAAPRVARSLRREREVEAVHRGDEYVRAIQLYYRSFGHYPGSLEQLEKTNNVRFLRQRYTDPITGKNDFRLIPVGQNKTTVKTFFGQPLAGIAAAGVGSVSSMMSPGIGPGSPGLGTPVGGAAPAAAGGSGSPAGGIGSSPADGSSGPSSSAAPAAGSSNAAAGPSATGATGGTATAGSTSSGFGNPIGSQPATSFSGTSVPFMGVGLKTEGDSQLELNQQTTYQTWEFLYDPRLDQLKAKAAALNGGIGSASASTLGQTPGSPGQSTGAFGAPATGPASPTSGTGSTSPGASPSSTPSGSPPGSQP